MQNSELNSKQNGRFLMYLIHNKSLLLLLKVHAEWLMFVGLQWESKFLCSFSNCIFASYCIVRIWGKTVCWCVQHGNDWHIWWFSGLHWWHLALSTAHDQHLRWSLSNFVYTVSLLHVTQWCKFFSMLNGFLFLTICNSDAQKFYFRNGF